MSKKDQTKLVKAYKKYRTRKRKNVLGVLRDKMAEIIFRTTKLEGKPITRKMVSTRFR